MANYDTMTEALAKLKLRGFTQDFGLAEDRIEGRTADCRVSPEDFEIVEVYRFEGMSNPDDSAVVYAIESRDGSTGTLVDAYGMYSDTVKAGIIAKMRITRQDDRTNGG
mgnify:FL=1